MALDQGIADLAEAIGTDMGTAFTMIGNLALLDTTDQDDLVSAINEVLAAVGSGGSITADSITDATTIGKALIRAADAAAARTAIGAGTSNLVVGTGGSDAKAGNYQPTAANISDATTIGRTILTAADAAAVRTAISAASTSDVSSAIAALVGGAGAAYDTLYEIQQLLIADDSAMSALTTAVNNRVRHDTNAQGLNSTQQGNARTNIAAVAAADVGDTNANFVTVYTTARDS